MTRPKGAGLAPAAAGIEARQIVGTGKRDGQPHKPLPKKVQRRGGRRSRQKGDRAERALVRQLQDRGFAAERVPLSGSAGGKYAGDLSIPCIGRDLIAEVKVRGHGFLQLYAWLDGRDLLILRADRCEPLVVLPLRLALDIAEMAERGKATGPLGVALDLIAGDGR